MVRTAGDLRDDDEDEAFFRKFVMSEETRLLYPSPPRWSGGYRWFQSNNVVDLQDYRSPIDKERVRRVLLGGRY
jgi:hypothetical protein